MISEIVAGIIGYKFVKKHIDEAKAVPRPSPLAEDSSVSERYKELYGIDPATGPEVEGEPVE